MSALTPHEWIAVGVLSLYLLLHHRSYRRNRRRGLSFKASWWGPLGIHMTRWFNF